MRKTCKKQLPLPELSTVHPKIKELEKISSILNKTINIYELVAQDLGQAEHDTGANGMTVEQVVRAAIIKQMEGFSYEELTFHLEDSRAYRTFCRFGFGETYAKSTLNGNIKAITAATWEQVNLTLLQYALDKDIEKGRKVRIDCTVVESNIHDPYDFELLWDSVRVLTRILNQAKDHLFGLQFSFMNHSRSSKRRRLEIMNAKNAKGRKKAYKVLIKMAEKTVSYAESAQQALGSYQAHTLEQVAISDNVSRELGHYLPLVRQR